MIGYLGIVERSWVIRCVYAVGDVDYMTDFGVDSNEVEWGMSLVSLTEGLHLV